MFFPSCVDFTHFPLALEISFLHRVIKIIKMKYFFLVLALLILLSVANSFKKSLAARISHIIVLMMENRSFDHFLGFLKADGIAVDGLVENMTCPRDPNDLSKGAVPISRGGLDVAPDDPKHDFDNIAKQINNNKMNGFVYDSLLNNLDENNSVSMFDSKSAPIINLLGTEFAIFDRWFSSVPGPTDPNRQFAMSGTSLGALNNFNGTLYRY